MKVNGDDHERTLALASIAIDQIKALRHSAIPRNYEVWYTYATGHHADLNKAINDALAGKGRLSEADLTALYDTYLSPTRFSERVDAVGAKMAGEIEQVIGMIDAAVGSAATYGANLENVTKSLAHTGDFGALRTVVESLVRSTKEMAETNESLESRLRASRQEITELQENLEAVRTESLTDPLTSLANRKYFDQALQKAVTDALEKAEPLTLIMTDIDHFKRFNDTFGHLTGDQVLRLVALSVKQNVKGQDIAARYGGEEFAIVLPATALRQAVTVADHIRRAVMNKELMKRSTGEHLGRVTISAGVAILHPGDTAPSLIERADACLYAAKHGGRNCVICETDLEVARTGEVKVA